MFCKYCGNELPENANFCSKCGKINDEANKYEESFTANEPVQEEVIDIVSEIEDTEKDELSGSVLKFGILGLAFGATGVMPILGLIFSIIAKAKASKFASKYNGTSGRASVGKGLATGGLISSIVWMGIWCLYVIYFIALIAMML